MARYKFGDLVSCKSLLTLTGLHHGVIVVTTNHDNKQCHILIPKHPGMTVRNIVRRHDHKDSGQMFGWVKASNLKIVRVYDAHEDEMICCGHEMSATAEPGHGNVFKCNVCGYFDTDVAASKLDVPFEELQHVLLQLWHPQSDPIKEFVYWLPGDPLPTDWPLFYQFQMEGSDSWLNTCAMPKLNSQIGWLEDDNTRRRWQPNLPAEASSLESRGWGCRNRPRRCRGRRSRSPPHRWCRRSRCLAHHRPLGCQGSWRRLHRRSPDLHQHRRGGPRPRPHRLHRRR